MNLVDKVLGNVRSCGDCLLWTASVNSQGCPVCRHDGSNVSPVRRHIWRAMGRKLDKRAIVTTCREGLCVAPEHLVQQPRGPKLGSRKSLRARVNMARANRARSALTDEQVQAIRLSDESSRMLAERYSMSRSQIRNIKSGKCWHEIAASPFAGLFKVPA